MESESDFRYDIIFNGYGGHPTEGLVEILAVLVSLVGATDRELETGDVMRVVLGM